MKNVSDIKCRENQNTHYMFNNVFSKVVPFHEIVLENVAQPDRPHIPNRIRRIKDANCMPDN